MCFQTAVTTTTTTRYCYSQQILTKLGALNVPEWYEAGKVSQEQTGIPLSE